MAAMPFSPWPATTQAPSLAQELEVIVSTAVKHTIVSAHAEYRPNDYVFARTQSRAQSRLAWEDRKAPLHSWTQMLFPALGALTAAAVLAEILH